MYHFEVQNWIKENTPFTNAANLFDSMMVQCIDSRQKNNLEIFSPPTPKLP